MTLISQLYLKKFFNVCFWQRERERERESMSGRGAEREGDPESKAGSRLCTVSTEPNAGLEPMNCEIMTRAEVRRSTDWAAQAPFQLYFLYHNEISILLLKFFKCLFLYKWFHLGTMWCLCATFWETFPLREEQSLLCQTMKKIYYYKFLWKHESTMVVIMCIISFPGQRFQKYLLWERARASNLELESPSATYWSQICFGYTLTHLFWGGLNKVINV